MDMTDFLAAAVSRKLRYHAAHVATRRRRCNALHACPEWGGGFETRTYRTLSLLVGARHRLALFGIRDWG
jgi:hypothetical protein